MQEMVLEHMGIDMQAMTNASNSMFGEQATAMMGMGGSSMNLWQELLPGENGNPVNDLLKKQYDVVYGSWPNSYDEIMLVLDENNELDDMTLYALGLEPKEDVDNIMEAAVNGKELQKDNKNWSYADIYDMDFRTVLNADCYRYDENTGLYTDLRDTDAGLQYLYDNGLKLKVTGIIRPNEDAIADYNKDKDEMSQIQYTDYVGLMMSSVTKIINTITLCIDCVCSHFVDCFFDYDWCDYADFCTGTHQRNWDSPCNWCIKTRCFQYV